MPARDELKDFRKRLDDALEAAGDPATLKAVAEAALNPIKKVRHRFDCKFCSRSQVHYVEIVDSMGAAAAMERLLNQARGRPQEEQEDRGLTVNITYVVPEDEEEILGTDG